MWLREVRVCVCVRVRARPCGTTRKHVSPCTSTTVGMHVRQLMRQEEKKETETLKWGSVSLTVFVAVGLALYYYVVLPMKQSNDPKEL